MAKAVKKAKKAETSGKKPRQGRPTEERKVAHSVNHPVRLDVLSILFERIASPNEMANQLRVALGTVSFHVTELVRDGVIELVKTEQRRGAIEHYYRACVKPEITAKEWKAMPKATRREIARLALHAIFADSLSSLRQGKLAADDDMYVAWIPMAVDDAGRDKVTDLQAEMLERLEEIKAEHEVPQTEDGDAAPVRVAVTMWFERGGLSRSMDPLPTD